MKKLTTVVLIVMGLSGCAYDSGSLDMGEATVDGGSATTITGQIKDASVQKEALYGQMRQNRDRLYKQMYIQSGFSVKFKLVEVSPGVKIQMMEEVSFREAPRFEQPLPSGPSEHPVWRFGEKVVNKGTEAVLWITGMKALDNILTGSIDAAQPKYYGTYNPQTAEPYVVRPEIISAP